MANELGTVIEDCLRDKGWSVLRFTLETGLTTDAVVSLIAPAQLASMPAEATLLRLSEVLDVPYRQLVVAAGVACGLPKNQDGEPTFVLRFVTNEELLTELRRRLVRGRNSGDAQRRRMSHLALMQNALAADLDLESEVEAS
jgi:hypothetical protein